MTLKLNNNIPAINAHRSLLLKDRQINKVLESISTGLEIVRGGDGPAALVISEQLRSQIAGLKQAISNTEVATSMVQTTEAALEEVSRILIDLRRLAVHASNDAANDKFALQADQHEVENIIEALNRIAEQTSFGSRKLLDGSGAITGDVIGNGLEFVSGSAKTSNSGDKGYDIKVMETATKSTLITKDLPDTTVIDELNPEQITLSEGGKTIKYKLQLNDTAISVAQNLNSIIKANGLDLNVVANQNKMNIEHNQYGSGHKFFAGSTSASFVSDVAGQLVEVATGLDIIGKIGNYATKGIGQTLIGDKDTPIEGLQVKYTSIPEEVTEGGTLVGKVLVKQNSLLFQLGADFGNTATVSLASTYAKDLAKNIANESKYKSIADIDLRSFQGAQDALKLVVSASNDISSIRGRLGSLQKNSLEATSNYLRNYVENISAAESTIRDADIAEKTAEFVKNQIQLQAASSAMIHANNSPKTVVQLLNAIQ